MFVFLLEFPVRCRSDLSQTCAFYFVLGQVQVYAGAKREPVQDAPQHEVGRFAVNLSTTSSTWAAWTELARSSSIRSWNGSARVSGCTAPHASLSSLSSDMCVCVPSFIFMAVWFDYTFIKLSSGIWIVGGKGLLGIEHPFAMTWMVAIGAIICDSFRPPRSLEVSLVIKNSILLWYMTMALKNPIACRLFCRHPLMIGLAQSFAHSKEIFAWSTHSLEHHIICSSHQNGPKNGFAIIAMDSVSRVSFLTFDRTNLQPGSRFCPVLVTWHRWPFPDQASLFMALWEAPQLSLAMSVRRNPSTTEWHGGRNMNFSALTGLNA